MSEHQSGLALLLPPYKRLVPYQARASGLRSHPGGPGSCVVWRMGPRSEVVLERLARTRPGGVALLVVLPPGDTVADLPTVLHSVRPHGILPYHPQPHPPDLAQVLKRPPLDLAGDVIDYLRWRGLVVDRDTIHLIRRILELSTELKSVSAVSRSIYLSRRALGRRLSSRGLPVPSRWLQIGRLLRVAVRLQNSDATISSIAFEHGYPDGFSLSNQMERLVGHRPSRVRRLLGWEWILESWLRREAETGGLRLPPESHASNAAPRLPRRERPVAQPGRAQRPRGS